MSRINKLLVLFILLLSACLFGAGCERAPEPEPSGTAEPGLTDTQAADEALPGEDEMEPIEAEEEAESEEAPLISAAESSMADVDEGLPGPEAAAEEPPDSNHEEPPAVNDSVLCTLSVSCAAILDNLDWLRPEQLDLVPADGFILPPTELECLIGDSAFAALQQGLKQNRIHMEFTQTPGYNSVYIEGIHNLYEQDCGALSGWTYRVNGEFPGYDCGSYLLNEGDSIEFVYTCDLGRDVGAPSGLEGAES